MKTDFLISAVIISLAAAGCTGMTPCDNAPAPGIPADTITVKDLNGNKVYEQELKIYGQIKDLGRLNSKAFILCYAEETIKVWYGMMVNDDQTREPDVDMDDLRSEDWVIVTGKLKEKGNYVQRDAFWAESIVRIKQ